MGATVLLRLLLLLVALELTPDAHLEGDGVPVTAAREGVLLGSRVGLAEKLAGTERLAEFGRARDGVRLTEGDIEDEGELEEVSELELLEVPVEVPALVPEALAVPDCAGEGLPATEELRVPEELSEGVSEEVPVPPAVLEGVDEAALLAERVEVGVGGA